MNSKLRFLMVCLLLPGSIANAVEFGAEAFLTAEYESNQTQNNLDKLSGWNYQPGARAYLGHDGDRFATDLAYQARRQINENEEFDDATYVTGRGAINWALVSDIWNVYAENQRTRSTIDNRLANNTSNQQTVDNSALGTNAYIPVGKHRLILQAEQSQINLNETENDSETDRFVGGYQIPLSENRRIRFSYAETETEFDNPAISNYESETTSFAFATESRRLQLSTEAGFTSTEVENSEDKIDGVTGMFDLVWLLADQSSIQFNTSRAISDNITGRQSFYYDESSQPDLSEELTLSGELFTATQFNLVGTTYLSTNRLSLSVGRSERDYEFVDRDEIRRSWTARLSRHITSNSSLLMSINYVRSSFEDTSNDESLRYDVMYNHQFSRRFSMDARASYTEQDSPFSLRDYSGWTASITVRYQLVGDNEPRRQQGGARRLSDFGTRI